MRRSAYTWLVSLLTREAGPESGVSSTRKSVAFSQHRTGSHFWLETQLPRLGYIRIPPEGPGKGDNDYIFNSLTQRPLTK